MLVERGAHRREHVAIGTDAHQLVIVNVQRDLRLVQMALAGHHHVGLLFPAPVHQLGQLRELRVQLLLQLGGKIRS